jgi:succinyl-CoA synthetase beta subunit
MEKSDFLKWCRAVDHGAEVYLENVVDHHKGRVLFCTSERFHVDIGGKRDSWLPQICESSSS